MARRRTTSPLLPSGALPAATALAVALALVLSVLGAPAAARESYLVRLDPTRFTFSPGAGAAVGSSIVLWSRGAASAYVTTTSTVRHIDFAVSPEPCQGSPHLELAADNVTRFSQEILAGRAYAGDLGSRYSVPVYWPPGRHKLTFRFLDDHRSASCDRNVSLTAIELSAASDVLTYQSLQSEGVTVAPVTAGEVGAPSRPWSGVAKLWTNGRLRFRLNSQQARELAITMTGAACGGRSAHVGVVMDGKVLHDGLLPHPFQWDGLDFGYFELGRAIPDGVHTFSISMSQDLSTPTCDRNLVLRGVEFRSTPIDLYPG